MDKIEHSEGKFKLIKITIPHRDSVNIIVSRFSVLPFALSSACFWENVPSHVYTNLKAILIAYYIHRKI